MVICFFVIEKRNDFYESGCHFVFWFVYKFEGKGIITNSAVSSVVIASG